jgi:hypothetical protein
MNLGQLLTTLDSYANRRDPDYVDNRTHFIQAGHRWIERKFIAKETFYQKWTTTEKVPVGVGAVPLPACYRASAELRVYRIEDGGPLIRIPTRGLHEPFTDRDGAVIDASSTTVLGTPLYYAVIGRSLSIRPLPSAALDLEIAGTGWAEPLVASDSETVLTQEASDAVLYAALRELWLFMGDDSQQTYWEGQAVRAVNEWMGDRLLEESPPPLVMETPG